MGINASALIDKIKMNNFWDFSQKYGWFFYGRLKGIAVQAHKYFRQVYPEQANNDDGETGKGNGAVDFCFFSAVHKSEMKIDDVSEPACQ